MSDHKERARAQMVFSALKQALDDIGWTYEEEDSVIKFTVDGDDLPLAFFINVSLERQIIQLFSPLPFVCDEKNIVFTAAGVGVINKKLLDGNFDFDIKAGRITFKMTYTFAESIIGSAMLRFMVEYSCYHVDKYNDKLQALASGEMDLSEFVNSVNE